MARRFTINAKVTPAEPNPQSSNCRPGGFAIGVVGKPTFETRRDYISVKLDDPSFPAPIYASLVETEGNKQTFALIWSRRNGN